MPHQQPHIESMYSLVLGRNVNVCICNCTYCLADDGTCTCGYCMLITPIHTHKKREKK